MKILTITDLYPPYYVGGYELRCQETVDEIIRRGHDVSVLTSQWGGDKARHNGNIYRCLFVDPTSDIMSKGHFFNPFGFHRKVNQLKWAIRCRENYRITSDLVAALKPDLIYIWNMEHVGINPILAAQEQGVPCVFSLGVGWLVSLKNETYLESNFFKRMWRQAIIGLRDFDKLNLKYMISISQWLKHYYVKNGFVEQNLTVIPRGVPPGWVIGPKELRTIDHKNSPIRLLFVGRVCQEKAPDDAIRAVYKLIYELGLNHVLLDIVGTGTEDYLQELKTLIAELKIGDFVRFLGHMEHSAILDLYPLYDILLFPSRWEEPLGVTVLEAMARGVPVIATDRGGISEMIMNHENGILVSANDPGKLAEAIKTLIRDRRLMQKLRLAALETIRKTYSLEIVVDRILDYFNNVLDEKITVSDI